MKPDALREGVIVGLLAYLTVALFYATANLVAGRSPLHTPAVLGKRMLERAGEVGDGLASVLAYHAVYLAGFLLLGIAVAVLVRETERGPRPAFLFAFAGTMGVALALLLLYLVASPIEPALSWWAIAGANLSAATAVVLFYRRRAGSTSVEPEGGRR